VVHILLAAIWFGATVSMAFFIMPAIVSTKPAGGAVMAELLKRRYAVFMESVSGLTIVTGFYLFYHYTQGFDPTISASMGGRVFGIGGVAGFLALLIGSGVVGRTAKQINRLAGQAAAMPDGADKSALLAKIPALQARAAMAGKIVLLLMLVAIVTMSLGHYV